MWKAWHYRILTSAQSQPDSVTNEKWTLATRRNIKYAFVRTPLYQQPTLFLATFFNLLFHLSGVQVHESAWQACLQHSGSHVTSSEVFPYHPVCDLPERLSQHPACAPNSTVKSAYQWLVVSFFHNTIKQGLGLSLLLQHWYLIQCLVHSQSPREQLLTDLSYKVIIC